MKKLLLLTLFLVLMSINVSAVINEEICAPADVMLVVDRSGSMAENPADPDDPLPGGDSRMDAAKSSGSYFLGLLDLEGDDYAGIASFAGSYPVGIGTLDHVLSQNEGTLNTALNGLTGYGYTCIGCGIDVAQAELDANGRDDVPHFIVLLSDGGADSDLPQDTDPGDAVDAADAAKAAGTIIYTIGIGEADEDQLIDIANPGNYYPANEDNSNLDAIYAQIRTEICEEPGPECGDGELDEGEQCDYAALEGQEGYHPECTDQCRIPDTPPSEIPEFSVMASLMVLGLAGAFIYMKR